MGRRAYAFTEEDAGLQGRWSERRSILRWVLSELRHWNLCFQVWGSEVGIPVLGSSDFAYVPLV